ncbi:hypothetical protein M404DRAFT_678478 [Pisolithus tinctorius Marx 270]|uniref:Uncharacterized protein n=1 Tax=Pisolithus tinctorius Marx 270 TaxID=870435 RepID=A0A0C3PUJ4_PISTI|nr:hypothetical protein M404DRAFT_678478 [Pisolithus tinctorius Marx 270]
MSCHSLDSFETCIQDPEQDEHGTPGELPTYDDVVAQSPNSRFGRWRGWIEKRAAERYADVSVEEHERRRSRGWGEGLEQQPEQLHTPVEEPSASQSRSQLHPLQPPLRIRVDDDVFSASPSIAHDKETSASIQESLAYTPTAASFVTRSQCQTTARETLLPTHLQVHQFGSRFLPHTTSPIHCVLPLQRDRLLLIGTDKGLSVMDMYPVEWGNGIDSNIGIVQKGPNEAQARALWTGEAVYQLSILEYEDIGEGTPQGVVLALVGPDPDAPSASNGHQESLRSLRMYNLASLMSLARWIITQQAPNAVDLRRASDWNVQQTPVKKHRSASSITRGLKNLIIESPPRAQQVVATTTSYESYLSAQSPKRQSSTATPADSSWDVVEDLPLRWATDFVPLASPTSRLASMSAIAYALWQEGGPGPGGGRHGRRTLLAVATKYNIFLYETPKGERAFHFVKEFYTPIQARNLTFVHQLVQDISRSQSDTSSLRIGGSGSGHARVPSSSEGPFSHRQSLVTPATFTYSAHMAIFVIFDKKASIIRIADAAVTEVEMFDGSCNNPAGGKDQLSIGSSIATRRSRASIDFMALREGKGTWILPSLIDIPPAHAPSGAPHSIYILSRGKQTHVISGPLPKTIQTTPPLCSITWNSPPSSITCRLCLPSPRRPIKSAETPSFLQLLGLGEHGIEVHEIPLAALSSRKGKDKEGTSIEATHVQSFIGETGFLATGGHWHQSDSVVAPHLERTDSATSTSSYGSVESEEMLLRLRGAAGLYCSLRKDVEDWRVFWVGGDAENVGEHDKNEDEDGVLV